MDKLRLSLDGLRVESFEAGGEHAVRGTVHGNGSCSMQPTCGIASRGQTPFEEEAATRYVCCV